MAADETIVIAIEFDDGQLETKLVKTSKKIEDTFSQKAVAPIEQTSSAISKVLGVIEKLGKNFTRIVKIVAIGSIALKAFGFDLVSIFKKLGVNIEPVVTAFKSMREILLAISKDPSLQNFRKLRDEILSILQAMGLLNNRSLLMIAKFQTLAGGAFELITNINILKDGFLKMAAAIPILGGILIKAAKIVPVVKELGRVSLGIGQIFLTNTRSIFGVTTALAASGAGFLAYGKAVERSNNELIRMSGVMSTVIGILLGSFAAALSLIIIKIGSLAFEFGTKLVESFQGAAKSFIKADSELFVFTKTIENFDRVTRGASGSVEVWSELVDTLSTDLNLSGSSLRKAAAEVVNVGSALHLTGEEMQKLLIISAEYAKVNGKDVFNTTVKMVNALNGNATAVAALGLKLNETSNRQFALRNRMDRTFASMGSGEKVQVRFNNLLEQHSKIAGLAAITTNTLADAQDKYQANLDRLSTSLGAGAALIENNNIAAAASNLILNNLNSTVAKVTGFFGALGARILQIGGLFLSWSFKIFAVVKIFKVLTLILSSNVTQTAFGKSIPIMNESINQLIKRLTGANIALNSTKNLFKVLALTVKTQANGMAKALFGLELRSLSFAKAFKASIGSMRKAILKILPLLGTFLVALAPIALKVAIIVGPILLLIHVFRKLEEQTGVLSDGFAILQDMFGGTFGFLDPLKQLFVDFGGTIKTLANKTIGFLVFALAKLFQVMTTIAVKNPFNTFSEETQIKIFAINNKLKIFSMQLKLAGFDMTQLGSRTVASVNKMNDAFSELQFEALAKLREELVDVGKSDVERLKEQLAERLALIFEANAHGVLLEGEFAELKSKVLEDFAERRKTILTDEEKAIAASTKKMNQLLVSGLSSTFSSMGAALAKGEDAFEAFKNGILGIIGDIMISMGTNILLQGKAIGMLASSLANLNPGPAIAAGLALITLGGALKALGGQKGGSAAGGGVAATSGGAVPGTETAAPETIEPGTNVVINVDAPVDFDRQKTGMELAEVLRDVFDTNSANIGFA